MRSANANSNCRAGISADGQENVPHREYLRVFDQVVNEVKAELKSQGREDDFIGARVRT